MGFVNSGTRLAVQRAVDGATRRLTLSECQRVVRRLLIRRSAPDHSRTSGSSTIRLRHHIARSRDRRSCLPSREAAWFTFAATNFKGRFQSTPQGPEIHRDPRAAPRARALEKTANKRRESPRKFTARARHERVATSDAA
jgi:hypothetical protein